MKKQLQFLFGAILFGSANLLAQPTLTATGINPVAGDVETVVSSTVATSPGSAGANQTWNLAITGTSSTYTIVTASSTAHGSQFPAANLANGGGGATAYYKTSSSAFSFCGTYGSVAQYYTNPEDLIHYPCTYNSTFTDAFACTYTSSATIYRNGTVTVTADGWGTLTTPAGTFGNVMRVHIQENYSDTGSISGFSFTTAYQTDEYVWYLNNNHAAIASVMTFTTNSFGNVTTSSSSSYLTNVAVGIESHELANVAVSLYPNPALGSISIDVNLQESLPVEIKLLNAMGEQVNATFVAGGVAGSNHFKFDLGTLPAGIYFARINANGQVGTRRFVIEK